WGGRHARRAGGRHGRGQSGAHAHAQRAAVTTEGAVPCGCHRSLGVIGALFASLGALALVAQEGCHDGGGQVSDAAWVCEAASGASVSIWSMLSPVTVAVVALAVGIPAYFGVNALGARL